MSPNPDLVDTEVFPAVPSGTKPFPVVQPAGKRAGRPAVQPDGPGCVDEPEARVPWRPWRIVWCVLAFGHWWWPGSDRCLDCGAPQRPPTPPRM
jgi:hypothetical protein